MMRLERKREKEATPFGFCTADRPIGSDRGVSLNVPLDLLDAVGNNNAVGGDGRLTP